MKNRKRKKGREERRGRKRRKEAGERQEEEAGKCGLTEQSRAVGKKTCNVSVGFLTCLPVLLLSGSGWRKALFSCRSKPLVEF